MFSLITINKRKILVVFVLLFFILTNPSIEDFKDYSGAYRVSQVHKSANFFVATLYQYQEAYYLGMIKNFVKIKSAPPGPFVDTIVKIDAIDTLKIVNEDSTLKKRDPLHILK